MQINDVLNLVLMNSLASWHTTEVFHHGSLFENIKAKLQAKGGFLGKLSSCPFCFSNWSAMFFSASACMTQDNFHITSFKDLFYMIIISLISSRLSNVANDVTKKKLRVENPFLLPENSNETNQY